VKIPASLQLRPWTKSDELAARRRDNILGQLMALVSDFARLRQRLDALPVATFLPGETVFAAGSKTGRLLILKQGSVAISKEGVEIAKVAEPGAVFGELSALLDQPHTADVRALEMSQFHAAEAAAFLEQDPVALLYVAGLLARRLDGANRALIELKALMQSSRKDNAIERTIEKMEGILGAGGASLVYAGYPYDPYAS
jgi:CRP-like cAMP-binding protein